MNRSENSLRSDKVRLIRLLSERKKRNARSNLLAFTEYTKSNYDAQWFHRLVCKKLDDFEDGKIKKLMIWMPPQHGKSELSTRRYPAYTLGQNPDQKLAVVSYNHTFASKFNRDIQRIIDSKEYNSLFPNTYLNESNVRTVTGSYLRNNDEFELVGRQGSLTSVGVGGGLTGRLIDKMIIDDVYKDSKDAWSPVVRENVWEWYNTVAETRLHNDSQQLIVFTRWHEEDIAGKLLKYEPDDWEVMMFPALKTDQDNDGDQREVGEALWEGRHSREKLLKSKKKSEVTFQNMYQQDPKPKEGQLYGNLNEYQRLPDDDHAVVKAYVDVADSGQDYLCSIVYLESEKRAFILDVIHTQKSVEYTEDLVSDQFKRYEVNNAMIESNNGGKAFARNVDRIGRAKGNIKTSIHWFHQSKNKIARIHSEASTVCNSIYFPEYWNTKYPEFHDAVKGYSVMGKNKHDDGPDALTGIAEELAEGSGFFIG